MNTILKWLARLFAGIAVLALLALLAAWYLVSRSLPDYEGQLTLKGLDGPVTIIRDAHAVPHIRAGSDHDAFFALGLVHAQDRLWQMELSRRAAQGRLSALLGDRTIETDLLMRTLDLYGYASRALQYQSPETLAVLDAYSAGVNAWIRHVNEEALGRGAPEFFAFGEGLVPWTPADSMSILKLMALRLSGGARNEVRRAQALLTLPPERVADILPDYPVPAQITPKRPDTSLPGANRAEALPLRQDTVAHLVGACGREAAQPCEASLIDPFAVALGAPAPVRFAGASNAWAVDGTRTSSGKPLMANDPHLWLSAPSVWHLAGMKGGRVQAIGGALPGVPSILIGRNNRVGWGLTTANVDDADLFVERVNPENSDEYLLPNGKWAMFEARQVRIEVADSVAVTETVRRSRHGPVLTGKQFGADGITPEGHVTALSWTALEDEDLSMTAIIELMYAERLEDGILAAAKVQAPAQNLTLTDADGVAMVVAGAIPMRRTDSLSQGRVPSAGMQEVNDWIGYRPASDNPRAVRPATGAVANANNRTEDADFPEHVSFEWAKPYRIARLDKEMVARAFHSREGFVALQNDAISEMARSILPMIARDLWWREGTPVIQDDQRRRALELLGLWNGEMDQHGPEPLIFAEWVRALNRRLAADELGGLFEEFPGLNPLFVERVYRNVDGASIWCDVDKTPETETCEQAASLALDDALARLSRDYGETVDGWRWGEEHVAIHRHTPFGYVSPISVLFNIEHETSGGDYTLLRGQTKGQGSYPFRNVHAAGLRVVYDFSDLDASQMIISTGQSGHPFSTYYDHLSGMWARGDMIPMSLSDEDARAGALGIMELTPAE
ncbi:MAG: penicillin acylase family protein [Pseudomonadota bacterium]